MVPDDAEAELGSLRAACPVQDAKAEMQALSAACLLMDGVRAELRVLPFALPSE